MAYNVVETTNLYGSKALSFQATTDIENGFLIAKGDLVTGETEVYTAKVPTVTDEVYLVANPAWSYNDDRATDQNEENFINKKGIAFRGRQLKKDNKFKVYSYGIIPITEGTPIAEGQFITIDGTTHKPKAVATAPESGFYGKVTAVDTIGFPYCVGSLGTSTTLGGENMGYTVDTTVTKVTIEVVKNV